MYFGVNNVHYGLCENGRISYIVSYSDRFVITDCHFVNRFSQQILIRGIFFPSGDLNYSERDKTEHNMERQVLHKRLSVQSDRPTIG